MKKILLSLCVAGIVSANTTQEGVKALKNGDYKHALEYFTIAAKQGDKIAQQNLGVMYKNAMGVKKDSYKASYWFNAASSEYGEDIYLSAMEY